MIRKALFWLHLAAGSIAGIAILVMCVTGLLLTYEKQTIAWVDRHVRHGTSAAAALPIEQIVAGIEAPTTLTVRAAAHSAVEAGYGRERVVYVDAATGKVLGEGARGIRAFFGGVENWHRRLAMSGAQRTTGRAITGACNLAFLYLVVSGLVLWMPKKWSWDRLKRGMVFNTKLSGRARDWNWHNSAGFWCCVPLFFIVLTGVTMSYPWANSLLYKLTGSEMPVQGERGGENNRKAGLPRTEGLDRLFLIAKQQAPDWQSINLRIPPANAKAATFAIDRGTGGRPDLRSQLTLNFETGEVVRWEQFDSYNPGKKLRSYGRFLHTGELGGLPGQTAAGLAAAGGILLVWTGIALALRRLARFRFKTAVPVSSEFQTTQR